MTFTHRDKEDKDATAEYTKNVWIISDTLYRELKKVRKDVSGKEKLTIMLD